MHPRNPQAAHVQQPLTALELRQRMVDGLLDRRLLGDPEVAAALREVPRHLFVPGVSVAEGYVDQAIPTRYRGERPTSSASQPAIVARMLEQLQVLPGQSVLEIGAGTGYNAALLARLAGPDGTVVTVDIDHEVAGEARAHLAEAELADGAQVRVEVGDGAAGWPDGAPYDRIILTAGASDLAPAWLDQLAPGGRLVVPLSLRCVQQSVAFAPVDGHLESDSVCDCGFMPLEGTLAGADVYHPVPDHPGLTLMTRAGGDVDLAALSRALSQAGPAASTGVDCTPREAFGSLRRWLAFGEPCAAHLSWSGTPEELAGKALSGLLEITLPGGRVLRATTVVVAERGLAALDRDDPDTAPASCEAETPIPLTVRPFGAGGPEAAQRLAALVRSWDAAGRPATGQLRVAAYRASSPHPPGDLVERARHTTFVVQYG